MPAKMERKVRQSGDSKVTALPPDWLRMFNIEVGDCVTIFYDSIVFIKPKGFKLDAEFLKKEFALIMELEAQQ